jgi:hypothetical protein
LFAPALNVTCSWPAAVRTARTAVGAAGAPTTTSGDAVDAMLTPRAFVAVTKHEYVRPVVTLATVMGDAVEPTRTRPLAAPPLLEKQ